MDIKIDFRQKIECLWNLLHSASSFYFNLCHAVIQSSSTFLRSILCQTLPFHTGGSFFHFKLETMGKTHQFLPLRVKLQINIKQILRICDFVFFVFVSHHSNGHGWLAWMKKRPQQTRNHRHQNREIEMKYVFSTSNHNHNWMLFLQFYNIVNYVEMRYEHTSYVRIHDVGST